MTERSNKEIALNVCALLDEFHGCSAESRPFYEPADVTVKLVLSTREGDNTDAFDAEIHGFFGCGDTPTDALLRLEFCLKEELRKEGICTSAAQAKKLGLHRSF